MKWEYKTSQMNLSAAMSGLVDEEERDDILNEYGKDGWELVGMTTIQSDVLFVFKRQKQ